MTFPRLLQSLTLALAISASAAGANPATTVVASRPAQLSDSQVRIAVDAVLRRLKDPDSVRAWPAVLHYADGGQNLAVCGLINARNSFGGYTGDQFYLVIMSRDATMATAIFDAELVCRAYGIIP